VKLIHLDPSSEESRNRVDKLVAAYKESEMYKHHQKELPNTIDIPKEPKKKSDTNFFSQFGNLPPKFSLTYRSTRQKKFLGIFP
jgi:hypothetical protein